MRRHRGWSVVGSSVALSSIAVLLACVIAASVDAGPPPPGVVPCGPLQSIPGGAPDGGSALVCLSSIVCLSYPGLDCQWVAEGGQWVDCRCDIPFP
jgi:hypothetical protein